jgi:hypothetical protein
MSLPYRPQSIHADARPVARMSIASSHPIAKYAMAHEILPGSAAHSVLSAWRKPPPAFYDPDLHLPHVISTTVIPSDVQKRMELADVLAAKCTTAHEILPGSAAHSVLTDWRKNEPPPVFYYPDRNVPLMISTTLIPSHVQKRMELATALRKRQATTDYPEFRKRPAPNYTDTISSTPATVRRPAYADVLASSVGAHN